MAEEDKEEAKAEEKVQMPNIKMNVFEAVATRRSIRKFRSQDIPMELIGIILDAGRYSPSAGNLQNWRFIIVKNKDNKLNVHCSFM